MDSTDFAARDAITSTLQLDLAICSYSCYLCFSGKDTGTRSEDRFLITPFHSSFFWHSGEDIPARFGVDFTESARARRDNGPTVLSRLDCSWISQSFHSFDFRLASRLACNFKPNVSAVRGRADATDDLKRSMCNFC